MGALASKAQATNTVDVMVKAGIEVLNTVTQNCYTSAGNVQGLSFRNVVGPIRIVGNSFDQLIVLKSQCMSAVTSTTETKQAVDQKLSQIASAVVGSLSLGSSAANNLMRSTLDLSQHIVNAFAQTCKSAASNEQVIVFDGTVGGITIGYNSFAQAVRITSSCVQNAVIQSAAAQDIRQITDQSGSAKNEGLLDFMKYIKYAAIALVIIVALVVVGGIFILPKLLADPQAGAAIRAGAMGPLAAVKT